jgi:polyketide cyclase/dehydrase/lipid transport protein
VLEIEKTTDGPTGVGTIYTSTVKDAGMKTERKFKLTEFDSPNRIRWTELSENLVTVPTGGYDLVPEGEGTRLTVHNEFEGHGFGKLLAPLALRGARKDADAFAERIKRAVEAA